MTNYKKIILTILLLIFPSVTAHADIVFPAIAHQFMVSLVVPGYYSILLAVFILLTECYFIKKFFKKNFFYGFGLAFLINLLSSIVGVFIVAYLESWTRDICLGAFGYSDMRLGTYLGLIPGYIITVLVEWLLLIVWAIILCKDKFKPKNLFQLSALMNFCSYLILLAGIFAADMVTHGRNFVTH